MQVNFYDYATTVNKVKEFGLVDPDDKEGKKPAFVSYDKTSYGKQRFFGAAKIKKMFESSKLELLHKITASSNVVTSPKRH